MQPNTLLQTKNSKWTESKVQIVARQPQGKVLFQSPVTRSVFKKSTKTQTCDFYRLQLILRTNKNISDIYVYINTMIQVILLD